MIFKKLILNNFKSHVNSEIKFQKGTTIILGDNGAGKSSIFEGINFALYKKYNTKSLNDLINAQANKMSVTLYFLVGQQTYKVYRERTQSKSMAQLFSCSNNDCELIVSGDKDVNSHIERLLETDADLFLNAIYIRQGEIDSLVTQKASDRKKNISKLLRLENLENAYKNIANLISNYELKKTQIMTLIDDNVENNKDVLENEQKKLQKQLIDKNEQLVLLQNNLQNIKEVIHEQNVANVTYQKLNNSKTQLEIKLQSLTDSLTDLDKKINNFNKYEVIIQKSSNLHSNITYCQDLANIYKEYERIKKEKKMAEWNIRKQFQPLLAINEIAEVYHFNQIVYDTYIDDSFQNLENLIETDWNQNVLALDEALEQEKDLVIKINSLKNIISINQESLSDLKSIDGTCPICQSDIDEEHKNKLIANYQGIIAENESKLEKRTKELNVLKQEIVSLEKSKRDKQEFLDNFSMLHLSLNLIQDEQKKLDDIQSQELELSQKANSLCVQLKINNDYSIGSIENLYNELLKQQAQYQEAVIVLKDKDEVLKNYQQIQKQHNDISIELRNTNKQIDELGFDVESLQESQQKQTCFQNEYYPLIKEIGEIENKIKYNQIQIDTIERKVEQNQENTEQVQKLNNFIKFLQNIRELYSKDGLQKDIRLVLKPQIEKYTQEFFNKFDFDYSNIHLSKDYDITLNTADKERDVTMMSGGEKIAIALSLRLAIAKAITANTVETILLDEPTTYLDSVRKTEFVNIIQNISLLPQMILITHDNELENAANNVIFIKKEHEQSCIEYDIE